MAKPIGSFSAADAALVNAFEFPLTTGSSINTAIASDAGAGSVSLLSDPTGVTYSSEATPHLSKISGFDLRLSGYGAGCISFGFIVDAPSYTGEIFGNYNSFIMFGISGSGDFEIFDTASFVGYVSVPTPTLSVGDFVQIWIDLPATGSGNTLTLSVAVNGTFTGSDSDTAFTYTTLQTFERIGVSTGQPVYMRSFSAARAGASVTADIANPYEAVGASTGAGFSDTATSTAGSPTDEAVLALGLGLAATSTPGAPTDEAAIAAAFADTATSTAGAPDDSAVLALGLTGFTGTAVSTAGSPDDSAVLAAAFADTSTSTSGSPADEAVLALGLGLAATSTPGAPDDSAVLALTTTGPFADTATSTAGSPNDRAILFLPGTETRSSRGGGSATAPAAFRPSRIKWRPEHFDAPAPRSAPEPTPAPVSFTDDEAVVDLFMVALVDHLNATA